MGRLTVSLSSGSLIERVARQRPDSRQTTRYRFCCCELPEVSRLSRTPTDPTAPPATSTAHECIHFPIGTRGGNRIQRFDGQLGRQILEQNVSVRLLLCDPFSKLFPREPACSAILINVI